MKNFLEEHAAYELPFNEFTEEMILLGIKQKLIKVEKNNMYNPHDEENNHFATAYINNETIELYENKTKQGIVKEITRALNDWHEDSTYEYLIKNIVSPTFEAEYEVITKCVAKRKISIPLYLLKGKTINESVEFADNFMKECDTVSKHPEFIEYLERAEEEIIDSEYSINDNGYIQILKVK